MAKFMVDMKEMLKKIATYMGFPLRVPTADS